MLYTLFGFIAGLFFIYISAVLLYHRLIKRWIGFSVGYLLLYSLASWWFFGRLPFRLPAETEWPLFQILFFLGTFWVIGGCLYRQLSMPQIAGIVACWLSGLVGMATWLGMGEMREFRTLMASLPYITFFVGSPLLIGWCFYRGMPFSAVVGTFVMFSFCILASIVAVTNYFGLPFGFSYELSPYARLWIELATVLAVVLGIPGVVAYGVMHGWEWRAIRGAFALYVLVMAAMLVVVGMTVGYEFIGQLLVSAEK